MIRRAYAVDPGLHPWELELYSLRDLFRKLRGAVDRERTDWMRAATIAAYVYNYGGIRDKGFKTKKPDELFPEIYGKVTTKNEFNRRWQRALEQEERYLQMVSEKRAGGAEA